MSIMENETNIMIDSSKPGDTDFNPPMVFEPANFGYEIALSRLETFFTFPNIEKGNNVVRISFDSGKNWVDLTIPIGCYNIEGINKALQSLLREKGEKESDLVLTGNVNTFKCVLEIVKHSIIVDFNVKNSISSVLGFKAKKYVGGKRYESESKVNILPVNSILVHCDVIKSSRVNGMLSPVIYNFFPNVSPADKIICQPAHLMYMPLSLLTISSMTAWITDEEGKVLDLGSERLTITFHIRKRR